MPLFETIQDLRRGADQLQRRPYGVIEVQDGALKAVHLRPWPKLVSVAESRWFGLGFKQRADGDVCWLYYNQPRFHRNFLALKYVISTNGASFQTVRMTLTVLDDIARIKNTDAIVCEVRNLRIPDRLLARWGWERHVPSSRRRHFIKRFYGSY